MRTRKWLLLLCILGGMVTFTGRPNAAPPDPPTVAFHAIGDIDGPGDDGATTVIKDATRVGGVIYAVGGAVTRITTCGSGPCPNTDTPILWRSDGSPIQALPELAPTSNNPQRTAFAITRDSLYIASSAKDNTTTTQVFRAVRVETNTLTNLNLNEFFPPVTAGAAAVAISSGGPTNGTVLYGRAAGRGIRFDTSSSTNVVIPLICPVVNAQCPVAADNFNPVAERGSSADGNRAVGTSFPSFDGTRRKAYRYVHGSGVTAIPLLDRTGGSTNPFHGNDALAVSADGNLVLVIGDSDEFPNGEAYLYDFSKPAAEAITALGAPNGSLGAPWRPGGRLCANQICNPNPAPLGTAVGGMTADGSVVAMNFSGVAGVEGQFAYFRNAHGWFNLLSVLVANGLNVQADGWKDLFIQGISPDGTLVYGAGSHFDPVAGYEKVDGFVADFTDAAIKLKDYNPQPVPVANTSIVGAWADDLTNPGLVFIFTADGVYYHLEDVFKRGSIPTNPPAGTRLATGFERGLYFFNGSGISFTTLVDTNGDIGASGGDGFTFPASVSGDVITFDEGDGGEPGHMYRIVGSHGSFAGAWLSGSPTQRDSSFAVVALGSGKFFQANDHVEFGPDGAERGTYTFTPMTCPALLPMGLDCYQLDVFPIDGGSDIGNAVGITPDGLGSIVLDDDGHTIIPFARVIDPEKIPKITSALSAVATAGQAFAYQITATNAPTTFGAVGLPAGLNIDADGLIHGTPSGAVTVDVTVSASNGLITDFDTLTLTVIAPATVSEGPTTVTPIPPDEPGGTPPVTIEFENVTNGGTISVVSIDPEADPSAPEPPAGFSLGDDPVYFEILPSEGLTFTGPVTVCFSYEGITFSGFPRLLHYDVDLMTWVDITTSVDTDNQIICGLTSSFSPFVIAATALDAKGFHAPIKPVAGELNTVKGGSTVALKFNVFSEPGVEVTDPADLDAEFEVSPVACEGGTPSDSDVIPTTGNTSLRYDTSSQQFVQNWKTPKDPGCYLVQLQGEGLLLSALFNVR